MLVVGDALMVAGINWQFNSVIEAGGGANHGDGNGAADATYHDWSHAAYKIAVVFSLLDKGLAHICLLTLL